MINCALIKDASLSLSLWRTFFLPLLFTSNFCNRLQVAISSIRLIVLILTAAAFILMGTLGLSKAFTCIVLLLLPADSTGFTLGIDRLFNLSDFLNFGLQPRSYCATERCRSSCWTMSSSSYRKKKIAFYYQALLITQWLTLFLYIIQPARIVK